MFVVWPCTETAGTLEWLKEGLPANLVSKLTVTDTGEGNKVCTGVTCCIAGGCIGGWWELEPHVVPLAAVVTGTGKDSLAATSAPFTGTGDWDSEGRAWGAVCRRADAATVTGEEPKGSGSTPPTESGWPPFGRCLGATLVPSTTGTTVCFITFTDVCFASLSNWGQGSWSTTGTEVFCSQNRNSTVRNHTQISYLSRQSLQKPRRQERKERKINHLVISYVIHCIFSFWSTTLFFSMWHVSLEVWVDTGGAFLNKLLPVSKDTPNNKAIHN